MKNIFFIILILNISFIQSSCNKDDKKILCENQFIKVKKAGVSTNFDNILAASILKGPDPITGIKGYIMNLVGQASDGSVLAIQVSEIQFGLRDDCMDQDKVWSVDLSKNYYDPTTFAVENVNFTYTDKNKFQSFTIGTETDGTFEFTQCDPENHTFSGKFHFVIEDSQGNDILFTEGSFDKICYQVIK